MSPSLPDRARRGVGRLARRARVGSPLVTVVLEVRGAEPAARAAIDSARNQAEPRLEILLVLVDPRLRPLTDEAVRGDWRVRVVEAPGADPAAVRRLGAEQAKGHFRLFLSPRQQLLPGALQALLAARGDDDVTVAGAVVGSSQEQAAPLLGRLLVPRDLWTATDDDGEPDGQVAALSLLAGPHVLVGAATLGDLGPERPKPFERAGNPIPLLGARIAHDEAMLRLLPEADRPGRAAGVLARDLTPFLLAAERCDDEQWRALQAHTASLVELAGPVLADVPVEDRVLAWLASSDRRADLVRYVADRRFAGGAFPTTVRDGLIRADLGVADVPDEVLAVTEAESPLRTRVRRTVLDGDDVLVEVWAAIARLDEDDPAIALSLTGPGDPAVAFERRFDPAITRWMSEVHQCHDRGGVVARVPRADLSPGVYRLEAEVTDRGVRRRGPVGELRLPEDAERAVPGPKVSEVELSPTGVALTLHLPPGEELVLVGPGNLRLTGRHEGTRWSFDLLADPWGLGTMPAPPGEYALVRDPVGAPVGLGPELTRFRPGMSNDHGHSLEIVTDERRAAALRLGPPLADHERGPFQQRRLQGEYLEVTESLDPRLVYFQSFLGQSPTDHPGAIQEALQRVRPEGLRMLWCVADSSVRVPEGAEPVLLRSSAWYDAMARAAWIVTNVELEPWFRRREGQQVLETYHGYPSKAMGLSQWRARDLPPSHVEQMLRRTSGAWNNLLTPIPEMDGYYRDNYVFEGRIISQGYPRDDALVSEGHEQRRAATRRRLGIAEHQTAILYAPTWRDDLATNFRSAQAVLHLDVAQVARDLGPDHVVLLRGHRFHATTTGGAQVLDVTSYPEINDLLLAADAAVLDYSSLRFDIALTGRPMVFLVPDLREYAEETRGFLYPFTDSAPGPLVETTAEVVDALRDLPGLERQWAGRIAAFNATYNPLADGHASDRVVAEFFAPLLEET